MTFLPLWGQELCSFKWGYLITPLLRFLQLVLFTNSVVFQSEFCKLDTSSLLIQVQNSYQSEFGKSKFHSPPLELMSPCHFRMIVFSQKCNLREKNSYKLRCILHYICLLSPFMSSEAFLIHYGFNVLYTLALGELKEVFSLRLLWRIF